MTKKNIERTKAEFIGKLVVIFRLLDSNRNTVFSLEDLSKTDMYSRHTYVSENIMPVTDVDANEHYITLYFGKKKDMKFKVYPGITVVWIHEPNPSNLN